MTFDLPDERFDPYRERWLDDLDSQRDNQLERYARHFDAMDGVSRLRSAPSGALPLPARSPDPVHRATASTAEPFNEGVPATAGTVRAHDHEPTGGS